MAVTTINGVYVSVNSFTVTGDQTNNFETDRRTYMDCGVDGIKYGTITNSNYDNPDTTVTLSSGSDNITGNLDQVAHSIISTGTDSAMTQHYHSTAEGDGGNIASISAVGEATLFLHSEAHPTIGGYETLKPTPSDHAEGYDTVTIQSSDGETLMDSYATVSGVPGTTMIPAGSWHSSWSVYIGSTSGENYFRAKWYKRNTSGVETYLFTVTTPDIGTGGKILSISTETVVSGIAMDTTDTIVVKMYAQTTGGGDKEMRYYYEGTEHYTHFHTPIITEIILDHGELNGLGDDDHTQYHNNARGDARYYTELEITTISGDLQTGIDTKISAVSEDTSPQLGGELDLNAKNISMTPTGGGSDDTACGMIVTLTVDTNASGVGAPLYMASDGNYDVADADAAGTMPCTALALETDTGSKKVLLVGYIRNDGWNWTVGGYIYVSTVAGALTQTAPTGSGDQVQIVGYATNADRMYFYPNIGTVEV